MNQLLVWLSGFFLAASPFAAMIFLVLWWMERTERVRAQDGDSWSGDTFLAAQGSDDDGGD